MAIASGLLPQIKCDQTLNQSASSRLQKQGSSSRLQPLLGRGDSGMAQNSTRGAAERNILKSWHCGLPGYPHACTWVLPLWISEKIRPEYILNYLNILQPRYTENLPLGFLSGKIPASFMQHKTLRFRHWDFGVLWLLIRYLFCQHDHLNLQ